MNYIDVVDIFSKRTSETEWIMNIDNWSWNTGVMIYCMSRIYEKNGDERLYKYIKEWIDSHMQDRLLGSVNFVIPAHGFLTLTDGKDQYKEMADEYAKWCTEDALLTCDGGLAHVWGSSGGNPDYKNQLWMDSLYMTVPFMIKYGLMFGDDKIIEKALTQLDIHTNGAYDEQSGLYFHAYHSTEKRVLGERWGRGNGWVVSALAHCIRMLDGTKWNMDKYKKIVSRMIETAYDLRNKEDDMLHTVLNNPESYTEYTATMLFSIAILDLFPLGLVDKEMHDWAIKHAKNAPNMIDSKKGIQKCSTGTEPEDMQHYLTRTYNETFYAYGLLMLLMFAGTFS